MVNNFNNINASDSTQLPGRLPEHKDQVERTKGLKAFEAVAHHLGKIAKHFSPHERQSSHIQNTLKEESLPVASKVSQAIVSFKSKHQKGLHPLTLERQTSDLFFISTETGTSLVAKPGLKDARLALMAQNVLEKVGLAHTMPEMRLGTLDAVTSNEFESPLLLKKNKEWETVAIEKDYSIDVTKSPLEHGKIFIYEEVKYLVRSDDNKTFFLDPFIHEIEESTDEANLEDGEASEVFSEVKSDFEDEVEETWIDNYLGKPFEIVTDTSGKQFLTPASMTIEVVKSKNDPEHYVMINDFPYKLEVTEGGYHPVGYKVPTLYLEKIENLFVGFGIDGLNITEASDERAAFYKRIDRKSFIDSFIATLLTRPQDGKIATLANDSNYLFREEKNGSLSIIQIDPDNLMPPNNQVSVAKGIKEYGTVVPIRSGLVGFPMATEKLTGEELQHLKAVIERVTSPKNEFIARDIIKMYDKTSSDTEGPSQMTLDRQQAYSEVIGRLRDFFEKHQGEVSLQELFFHVFPEYAEHYKKLIKAEFSPERAALSVGSDPVELIDQRS